MGKSSTVISLSGGLAKRGKNVLLVDIDSQANASKVLLPDYPALAKGQTLYITILEHKPIPLHPTTVPQLDIAPSHVLLSDTDMELTTAIDHRDARLRTQLDQVKDRYDFVLIDCPPALNWLTVNAFTACDRVIVVIEPGYFELKSTVQIGKTLNEVRELFNPKLKLWGFLFNKADPTNNSKTSLKILRQTYSDAVLSTIIPRNVDLRDASFNKQEVFSYNPHSKAAEAYDRVIDEVFL